MGSARRRCRRCSGRRGRGNLRRKWGCLYIQQCDGGGGLVEETDGREAVPAFFGPPLESFRSPVERYPGPVWGGILRVGAPLLAMLRGAVAVVMVQVNEPMRRLACAAIGWRALLHLASPCHMPC
jgi:hypothetical protein